MKRFIITISILTMALLPFGCANKDATASATTKQAAPALPNDVQNVAAAATATSAPATTTEAAGVSSESGGTIVATGELISPVRSELAVKVPGRVAKMYVDEGSRISRGQALLDLETDYPRLNLEKAQADIARAASAEQDAQRDLNRKKELIAKESIPQATYDRSQAMFDQARAAKESAQAQANIFRQQMADSTLPRSRSWSCRRLRSSFVSEFRRKRFRTFARDRM
jgi:multidrug efflux pump subunit AcrA (membrane-fusion protein)